MVNWIIKFALGGLFLLLAVLYVERGRLLRRSTWRLLKDGGLGRLLNGSFVHAFAYIRWPREYVGLGRFLLVPLYSRQMKHAAAGSYHGKVLTTELAKRLVSVNQPVPLHDVEHVLPYPRARELVLQGPPEIVVVECPCRATRPHPCQPTQVCMIVGQPFVDFILEHHPATSRRLTTAEAVQLLEDEHNRGHLQAAYFKDVMLGRFYAICNCCKCCCGAIEVMTRHGLSMITSSGYLAQVDEISCAACGTCEEVCAFHAIQVDDFSRVDWQRCMGCGVCESQCPNNAIHLVRDERKGVPLDVMMMHREDTIASPAKSPERVDVHPGQ